MIYFYNLNVFCIFHAVLKIYFWEPCVKYIGVALWKSIVFSPLFFRTKQIQQEAER